MASRPSAYVSVCFQTAGLLLLLLGPGARAQSAATLEAVRVHQPAALSLAKGELAACKGCPEKPRLSLLVAYLALSEGDAASAREQLLSVPPPPLLAPWHAFYLGEALFYSRDPAGAAARFAQALEAAPPSLAPRARARLGEAWLAAGEPEQALPFLDRALVELDAPELYFERARARAALGDAEGAQQDLRAVAVRFPAHPDSLPALAKLEAQLPQPLTFEDRLDRARGLLDVNPAAALSELDEIGKRKLDKGASAKAKVALAAATALYALGRDADAEVQVERARKGQPDVAAEAALLRARRALRADQNEKARAQMADIERRYPRAKSADEAGYFVGWIDVKAGALEQAVKDFEGFLRRHPRSRRHDEAYWFQALALIRLERYAEARGGLEALEQQHPQSSLIPQALYWSARSRQLAGEPGQEVASGYRRVIEEFPGSFYGWLADARLRELGEAPPRPFPTPPQRRTEELPAALDVAVALVQTGLLRDAGLELQRQTASVRSAEQALVYGHALQRLGEYGQAYFLAQRHLWGQAFTERAGDALALFFPQAYAPSVEAEARAERIDPELIWAIMRRESGFKADVQSAANARGLMQLLPATGAAIAREIGMKPPDADELFSPELNVRLGAWYLAALEKRFKHPTLVAAAYNAGPTAALKWAKERGKLPLDLFVELIPYKETRGYVKQVVADLHNYRSLYEPKQEPRVLELGIPTPDESGVAF